MKLFLAPLVLFSTSTYAFFKQIPETENTQTLVPNAREITSVVQMQNLGLNAGSTGIDLWSGSYWPQFQGLLANRYLDRDFQSLMSGKGQYKEFTELAKKKPIYSYSDVNALSPAEKYDLVVGDDSMGLTKHSWESGEKTGKLTGKVPVWRGICDGWASASQMMPRPVQSVTLTTPRGQPVTFFPEDIKALGSLSYARSQKDPIFLGKRCTPGNRFFSDACDETNPGAFHKALANRVGRMKKTFIADVSPGSEVWNYPIQSYKFTYYNILTQEDSADVQGALESFDPKDKKKFKNKGGRDKRTRYIVGVVAEVNYMDMRDATITQDKIMTKSYDYDLELDYNLNIVGGESVSKDLPDFIWAPNDQVYPLAEVEATGMPRNAYELAAKAKEASKDGQPLSIIVRKLFEAARAP